MAKTATVTWKLPTTRESGGPLPIEEIAGVEVALAIVGGPYSVLKTVPPDTLEHTVADLDAGDWAFRLVCIDTDGRRSAEVAHPFSVPDETPPGIVTDVAVDLV